MLRFDTDDASLPPHTRHPDSVLAADDLHRLLAGRDVLDDVALDIACDPLGPPSSPPGTPPLYTSHELHTLPSRTPGPGVDPSACADDEFDKGGYHPSCRIALEQYWRDALEGVTTAAHKPWLVRLFHAAERAEPPETCARCRARNAQLAAERGRRLRSDIIRIFDL
jgi:hypothetical protein